MIDLFSCGLMVAGLAKVSPYPVKKNLELTSGYFPGSSEGYDLPAEANEEYLLLQMLWLRTMSDVCLSGIGRAESVGTGVHKDREYHQKDI